MCVLSSSPARPGCHEPTARVSELDLAWFRRRPDRFHRVRRRIPGEPGLPDEGPPDFAPDNLLEFVALRRGSPTKVAIWGTRTPCGCEECAATLWRELAPGPRQATAIALRTSE